MAAQALSTNESSPFPPLDGMPAAAEKILTSDARAFLIELHRAFHRERSALLNLRAEQADWLRSGGRLSFPHETRNVRASDWSVAPAPSDLRCRHVEITGPAEPKMMINALNSGADVFMVDLEDSLSPTWDNALTGQRALYDAVRGRLELTTAEGKTYKQNPRGATLVVRPRGWHLIESHFHVDGRPISASLFDFGLFFFHNARALIEKGSGPYFYLAKLESAREARLWNKVFLFAQERLGIPPGTIRATVLIETITAAFEMDEILFELREHAAGLNAGRWDYLFSAIKKFSHGDQIFPDRSQLTMNLPFMKAYCELLVQTCHKRGAHAIGGMSAFIPSRKDAEVNRIAFEKVTADKEREIGIGFDGSWVAHPDLVPLVKKLFSERLAGKLDQKQVAPTNKVAATDLLPRDLPGAVTEGGVRLNIEVALLYMNRWLNGQGAVAIHNLMEDAATAEISRAQLWQWVHHGVRLDKGARFTEDLFRSLADEELAKLRTSEPMSDTRARRLRALLDYLVTHHEFVDFLTKPAYEILLAETDTHIN